MFFHATSIAVNAVITIEDTAELELEQDHVVTLEARPANLENSGEITIRDLVRNSLRMRPDRLIIGECRGGEALDMLQAMNTGHSGCLTTLHANSARDALARIGTMYLMAGMDMPMQAVREQIVSAIDLIVFIERDSSGRRAITSITEVANLEGDIILTHDIFSTNSAGKLTPTGIVPRFIENSETNYAVIA